MKKKSQVYDENNIVPLKQSLLVKNELERQTAFRYSLYAQLLQKRSVRQEEIKKSLLSKVEKFSFNNWWRMTTFGYSENPLSAVGSYKNPSGGRFNIGKIDSTNMDKFISFPALYLAETKEVAINERYPKIKDNKLSSPELMLRTDS